MLPTKIEIETISKCNRSCGYCPVSVLESTKFGKSKTKFMSETMFFGLIDELAELGLNHKDFSLGTAVLSEPLLDKRIFILWGYARSKLDKAKFHLATNGDLLDQSRLRRYLKTHLIQFVSHFMR